jgi:FkbM family methyltransferase
MVVVDVGAHIGYFALLAAKLVGEEGRVFAFEPVPDTYQLLCRNIEANNLKNIVPIPKAVWNQGGISMFTIRPESLAESSLGDRGYGKQVEVETVRLDDFFSDYVGKVDFVKMDIEGVEPAALEGMESVLASNPRLIMVTEFYPIALRAMGGSPRVFLNKLSEVHGFRLEAVLDGDKVEDSDFIAHMPEGYGVNLLLTCGPPRASL